jgi:8-oxo-dGTP pyrophosphatase MutT (NUDIX family)
LTNSEILARLGTRLQAPLPGRAAQEKMIGRVLPIPLVTPANARLSAVMCLLFEKAGRLSVILMQRMEDHTAHSGQVSFPGGKHEELDGSLLQTALREAWEEIGVGSENIQVLGALTSIYIPVSNFQVFPYIGVLKQDPEYKLNRTEVFRLLEVPLQELFHPDRKTRLDVVSPAIKKVIPNVNAYKLLDGTVIWGATAMILSELETLFSEL